MFKGSNTIKILLNVLVGVLSLFLGFLEIYLGEHFIHQIIIGWVYGYFLMILMLFLDKKITRLFITIGFKYNTPQAKSYIVQSFVVTILLLAFAVLDYSILAFPV